MKPKYDPIYGEGVRVEGERKTTYYYIKLPAGLLLSDDRMTSIMRTPAEEAGGVTGDTIALVYLQLVAKSLNTNGILMIAPGRPHTVATLAGVLGRTRAVIETCIDVLRDWGLVTVDDNGVIAIGPEYETMVGRTTSEALRKAAYRKTGRHVTDADLRAQTDAEGQDADDDAETEEEKTEETEKTEKPEKTEKTTADAETEKKPRKKKTTEPPADAEELAAIIASLPALPCIDGTEWRPTAQTLRTIRRAYAPDDVDFRRAAEDMLSWLTRRPTGRKSARGMGRFFSSWIDRDAESGKYLAAPKTAATTTQTPQTPAKVTPLAPATAGAWDADYEAFAAAY